LIIPEAVSGLVLLSGYYHPTLRADVPLSSVPAIPVIGDLIRYTVGPFFGSALLPLAVKGMFAPLPVPNASPTASLTDYRYGLGRSAPRLRISQ
jgi:hypothetical protein